MKQTIVAGRVDKITIASAPVLHHQAEPSPNMINPGMVEAPSRNSDDNEPFHGSDDKQQQQQHKEIKKPKRPPPPPPSYLEEA